MKKLCLSLVMLCVVGVVQAATDTVTVNWTNPTTNVDGSAIVGSFTFNIYQGPSGGPWTEIDSAVAASGVKETVNTANGTCFVVATVAASEAIPVSPMSVQACLGQPSPPGGVTVQ